MIQKAHLYFCYIGMVLYLQKYDKMNMHFLSLLSISLASILLLFVESLSNETLTLFLVCLLLREYMKTTKSNTFLSMITDISADLTSTPAAVPLRLSMEFFSTSSSRSKSLTRLGWVPLTLTTLLPQTLCTLYYNMLFGFCCFSIVF